MHRPDVPCLRSARLPRRWRTFPTAVAVTAAEFPAGVNTYRAYRAPWFASGGHGRHG